MQSCVAPPVSLPDIDRYVPRSIADVLESLPPVDELPPLEIPYDPPPMIEDVTDLLLATALEQDVPPPTLVGDNEVVAPMLDLNGTFTVRWGAPNPCDEWNSHCGFEVDEYVLEMATDSNFAQVQEIYRGRSREFNVHFLPPAEYYFRVRAYGRSCDVNFLFGSRSDCDDPGNYYSDSLEYGGTFNKTVVPVIELTPAPVDVPSDLPNPGDLCVNAGKIGGWKNVCIAQLLPTVPDPSCIPDYLGIGGCVSGPPSVKDIATIAQNIINNCRYGQINWQGLCRAIEPGVLDVLIELARDCLVTYRSQATITPMSVCSAVNNIPTAAEVAGYVKNGSWRDIVSSGTPDEPLLVIADPLEPILNGYYEWDGTVEPRLDPGASTGPATESVRTNNIVQVQSGGVSSGDGKLVFTYRYSYDELGRVQTTMYPTGFSVTNHYGSSGELDEVYDSVDPSTPVWHASEWDVWGHVEGSRLRNGIIAQRSYDAAVGRLDAIISGAGGTSGVQALTYGWDAVGNLRYRLDGNQDGLRESFDYDALNRLTKSGLCGIPGLPACSDSAVGYVNLSMAYAANGNITSKSDVGTYGYGASRPHAVTGAGSSVFTYDNNGNMTLGAGRSYTWASYNMPVQIAQGGNVSDFLHGPERQRIRQLVTTPTSGKLIYYVGNLYEEHQSGSAVEMKHNIQTPEGVVAVETWWNNGTTKREYLHRDHLGSVDAVTNAAGQVNERLSYDAFGKRRGTWQGGSAPATFGLTRGFTGHEHLDHLGLIHMNGRIYDPLIGRFLSADPIVQAPELSQSYNRYSYVMNNPLTLTDPSGYSWLSKAFKKLTKWVKNNWRTIVAVGITFIPGINAVAAGFLSGLVASGGDLRAAVMGAWTAGVFSAIGSTMPAVSDPVSGVYSFGNHIAKIVAHGLAGGISSFAMGGKFRQGFLSLTVSVNTRHNPHFFTRELKCNERRTAV